MEGRRRPVALKTDSYYRQIVEDLLRRAGVEEPPVSMESVARALGVPVRLVRLPVFFRGALVSEEGLPVIVLNVASFETERRDALAHMLGHVLIVLTDAESAYPRGNGPHEEADRIATELTLPTRLVIEQSQLWFNDYRYMSRLFGVDEHAMIQRMRELGVSTGTQSAMWDY